VIMPGSFKPTVLLMLIVSSSFGYSTGNSGVDSGNYGPPTRSCNVTLTEPGYVAAPEAHSHTIGSYLHCTTKIRKEKTLPFTFNPFLTTCLSISTYRFASVGNGVIKIEFIRFKLGELDGGVCSGGAHMTIVEDGGGGEVETSEFGRFCGESDQIHSYYAENAVVDVVFAAEQFADDATIDFEFLVTLVPRSGLRDRFGPRPDLFPHARGNLVSGTFCERVFADCSRINACFVQSPGYPGVYPKNLK
jgi:hypothetical protein